MEYRQVPVNVDHLACFLLNRDAVVDLRYSGGKYWQLSLRHPWVLALTKISCNRFRLIPFSSNQQIHWARSGGLTFGAPGSINLNSSNFGHITQDISGNGGLLPGDYRVIQLALKLAF